jgi:UDP-N-acetylglucosamine transferase subunit ALG13
MGKRVFVTVGTTRFSGLVQALENEQVLRSLRRAWDCDTLVVQHGSGPAPARACIERHGMILESFPYSDSLRDEQERADLIISHAGAGSILEALEHAKPLVVVVNESLMDNHQWELARALAERKALVATTCAELGQALEQARRHRQQRPLPPACRGVLTRVLFEES